MKKKSTIFATLILFFACIAIGFAQPFSSLSAFQTKTDGTIVYAADWNTSIGTLYTYITDTLLPQLNAVLQKGDMYVYNGTTLAKLGVGSDGQVLTADSTKTLGLAWEAGAGLPITTKGDIIVGNSSGVATRLAAGTDGYVLTADSTKTNGVAYELVANLNPPSGAIIMWYGPYGGSVPSGWHLCDGTNGTPNMIGVLPIGGQTSTGSATPNTSGYGNTVENTIYGGTTTTHYHTYSGTSSTPTSSAIVQAYSNIPASVCSTSATVTYGGATSSTSVTTQPVCMGIQFIMKL